MATEPDDDRGPFAVDDAAQETGALGDGGKGGGGPFITDDAPPCRIAASNCGM